MSDGAFPSLAGSWDPPEEAPPGLLVRLLGAERGRWILWLPVFLGFGVAVYFALPAEPPAWLAPAGLAALAFVLPGLRDRELLPALARVLVALLLGLTVAQAWSQSVAAPVIGQRLGPLTVEGRIRTVEPQDEGWRLVLDRLVVEGLAEDGTPERVRLRLYPDEALPGGPMPGQRIRLSAMLMPPPAPVAPGAFDFARGLWFDRIGGVGYALGPMQAVAPPAGDDSADSPAEMARQGVERLRTIVTRRLLQAAGVTRRLLQAEDVTRWPLQAAGAEEGPGGALAAALITGERRSVPEDVQDALRASGLAHLLAISGLHMSMVGGLLFLLVRGGLALWPRAALAWPIKKVAAVAALGGIAGYLLLSGGGVPAQRAFVMTGLVLLAVLADRTAISMRTVALAAGAVLLLRPESLLGPSFQMSFAAVIALVATYESLWPRLGQWRAQAGGGPARAGVVYLATLVVTTLVAGFATMPFAAFHFHKIALYGLVANVAAVPVMGFWIMPWCLAALALMPLGLESWALVPLSWGLDWVVLVARTVAGWPGAVMAVPAGPGWTLGLVAVGGLWLCLWRRSWRWAGVAGLVVGTAVPWLVAQPDLLVSRDGALLAARAADGGLLFSTERKGAFSRELWAEAHGPDGGLFPDGGETADGRLSCDRQGCLYRLNGRLLALPHTLAALMEDAPLADGVIAGDLSAPPLPGAAIVIDRTSLARSGAVALWIATDGTVTTRTVADAVGDRPWSRY